MPRSPSFLLDFPARWFRFLPPFLDELPFLLIFPFFINRVSFPRGMAPRVTQENHLPPPHTQHAFSFPLRSQFLLVPHPQHNASGQNTPRFVNVSPPQPLFPSLPPFQIMGKRPRRTFFDTLPRQMFLSGPRTNPPLQPNAELHFSYCGSRHRISVFAFTSCGSFQASLYPCIVLVVRAGTRVTFPIPLHFLCD